MSVSPKRRLITAIVAVLSAGVFAGGSVVTAHLAGASTVPPGMLACPATEPLVPGEDNDIVGNPDGISISGAHFSFQRIKNVGGGDASGGIRYASETSFYCRYDYEVWGVSDSGEFFVYAAFFRVHRPYPLPA